MKQLRKAFKKNKGTTVLLVLFVLHFLGIHGIAENLIYCFESDGQINIESIAGSIFTIPSEDVIHAEDTYNPDKSTYIASGNDHYDVSFSVICSKEQRTMRFDQQRILKIIDGILDTRIEQLAPSRVFQSVTFLPPLIEDIITSSLQTVILLN